MASTGFDDGHEASLTDFPPELLAEARAHPGGWVYAIDPRSQEPDGSVPPHGIRGAWRVSRDGKPVGKLVRNPNYRPSSPT